MRAPRARAETSVAARLACALGRRDERPNVALAELLAAERDTHSIADLVGLLAGSDKAARSDAIKVLYEVGARNPTLIAPHHSAFAALLTSRENRLVWGAMCALDEIARVDPRAILAALPKITEAADRGSVITRDHAVKALVKLAADPRRAVKVMPWLSEQLRTCPVNQLAMYAELVATITSARHAPQTHAVLSARLAGVTQPAKRARIQLVLKRLARA